VVGVRQRKEKLYCSNFIRIDQCMTLILSCRCKKVRGEQTTAELVGLRKPRDDLLVHYDMNNAKNSEIFKLGDTTSLKNETRTIQRVKK